MYIHNPSPLTASDPPRQPPGPPRRPARYEDEPGFYRDGKVWLYGNSRLLRSNLVCITTCFDHPSSSTPAHLESIEGEAEEAVLAGKTLVCGMHNDLHQRAAIVPLRWGAPRIMVLPGGFFYHLGSDLRQEPFRAARLWRYQWDARTDLAVSKRAPDKLPTYALYNPSVDRFILRLATRSLRGFCHPADPFGPNA